MVRGVSEHETSGGQLGTYVAMLIVLSKPVEHGPPSHCNPLKMKSTSMLDELGIHEHQFPVAMQLMVVWTTYLKALREVIYARKYDLSC